MSYYSACQVISGTFDAKSAATTNIQLLESSKAFMPLHIIVQVVSQTGTVTLGPTFSVGTNANTDNVIAVSLLSILSLGATSSILPPASLSGSLPAGSTLSVKVTIPSVGGTVQTVRIDMVGYYIN